MRKGNQKNTNDESPIVKKLLKKNGKTFHNAAALDIADATTTAAVDTIVSDTKALIDNLREERNIFKKSINTCF